MRVTCTCKIKVFDAHRVVPSWVALEHKYSEKSKSIRVEDEDLINILTAATSRRIFLFHPVLTALVSINIPWQR